MDLEGLNHWLAERNLKGHWDHQPWSQTVRTHLWKGKDIFEGLNQAGELITTGEAGRRTIQMRNPGLSAGMTNTIHISVQLVNPGEVAPRIVTRRRRSVLSSKATRKRTLWFKANACR
jgi:gentisate 1,2-dioxygenase